MSSLYWLKRIFLCLLLLLLLLLFCGAAGRESENITDGVTLSFGTPVYREAGGEVLVPVILDGLPDGGGSGLMLTIVLEGEGGLTSVTRGEACGGAHFTYLFEDGQEKKRCAVLIDGPPLEDRNFYNGVICYALIAFSGETPSLAVKMSCTEIFICQSEESEKIVTLPVTCREISIHREKDTETETETETEAHTEAEEISTQVDREEPLETTEPPALPVDQTKVKFIGVQETKASSDGTYAVRFLFLVGNARQAYDMGISVICLSGGGQILLDAEEILAVEAFLEGERQVYLPYFPDSTQGSFLAFTFAGLMEDKQYVFTAHDGNKYLSVVYEKGRLKYEISDEGDENLRRGKY